MLFSGIIFIILLLLASVHQHIADRLSVALSICIILFTLKSIGNAAKCRSKRNKKSIFVCVHAMMKLSPLSPQCVCPYLKFYIAASTSFQPTVICFVREHETQLMTGCNGKMKHFSGLLFRPLSMSIQHHTLARFISAFQPFCKCRLTNVESLLFDNNNMKVENSPTDVHAVRGHVADGKKRRQKSAFFSVFCFYPLCFSARFSYALCCRAGYFLLNKSCSIL